MDMPESVKAYFDADKGKDPDLLAKVFSPEAVVHDEGKRHQGSSAIRKWWLVAKAKYDHVAEPFETERNGDEISVRAKVSGQFPNSPVTLNYVFLIKGGKVVEMGVK
ncbi:MAG: nuclear transport factor 2 family protein [Thalassospira sp.]|uniref:nuclear transport factor 2 family protein n=1 Tax=Thalassospira sp. TaxID=1912094 RepID=UPI0032EF6447